MFVRFIYGSLVSTTSKNKHDGLYHLFIVPQSEVDLLFDQVMLSELRGTLEVLDARVFAELRSYMDPPPVVNLITKALLAIFEPEKTSEEWNNCKSVCCIRKSTDVIITIPFQSLSLDLVKKMRDYDPLHATEPVSCFNRLCEAMQPIANDSVVQHGSLPALHLYNWLSVTLSLLEHASKMTNTQ